MVFLIELYYTSDKMFIVISFTFALSTFFWILYFIRKLVVNFRIRRNLLARNEDIDTLQKIEKLSHEISLDALIIIVLISELIFPILISFEMMLGQFSNDSTAEFMQEYNCSMLTRGTYISSLFSNGIIGFIFESLKQGFVVIHPRLYILVLQYLISSYGQRQDKTKCLRSNLVITLFQVISVVLLTAIVQVYLLGFMLSVFYMLWNFISIIRSSRRLSLNLKFYLQDISLILTNSAIQEHKRIKRMAKLFKIVMVAFAVLYFIVTLGFVVFTIGCLWVEWLFLFKCSKINPYAMRIIVSGEVKSILNDISYVSRAFLSFCGFLYFSGIFVTSSIMAVRNFVGYRKTKVFRVNKQLVVPLLTK